MSEAAVSGVPRGGSMLDDRMLRLRADQLDRWGRGQERRVEDYLAGESGLGDDAEAVLELIYHEFVLREELGQAPTPAEYLARFPHFAEALRRQFDVHALLADPVLLEEGTGGPAHRDTPRLDPPLAATLTMSEDVPSTSPLVAPLQAAGDGRGRGAEPVAHVAGYEILGELGHGGMGVVYKALQPGLHRVIALKMIGGPVGGEGLARFRVEAEAVARLQHPNIVQVYEVGEHAGRPFVALEYVAGGNLADRLRGNPLPPRVAGRLLVDLARAMHHAHERGIIHRDLKPANILLQPRQAEAGIQPAPPKLPASSEADATRLPQDLVPKIADFGLAKQLDAEHGQTRSGLIMGTPSYMPPEQAEGRQGWIGPASDVYSLGAILYEILTGRPPFLAARTLDTLRQVIHDDPVTPSRLARGTPRDLETICLKCLQKDPRQRYPSAAALADDLERYLAGQPVQARRTPAWERAVKWARRHPAPAALLVAGLVVALAGLGAWAEFTRRLGDEKRHAEAQEALARYQVQVVEGLKGDLEKEVAHAREAEQTARTAKQKADEAAEEAAKTSKQLADLVSEQAMSVKGIAYQTRSAIKTLGKEPGEALVDLAFGYTAMSTRIRTNPNLPPDVRKTLADQYAQSAADLLKCADDQTDYFAKPPARERLKDGGLTPLHNLADFRNLAKKYHVLLTP